MFGNFGRMVTILGGVCAVLVAGEVMLGEKSTPLTHDPELRAMQHAPDITRDISVESFCVTVACPASASAAADDAAAKAPIESASAHLTPLPHAAARAAVAH